MQPPVVENIDAILARLLPAYQGQKDIYGKMLNDQGTADVAQEAGLQAQQKSAFGDIEQRASNKGMLFSGFSPSEQASYNATKYMPALANLKASGNAARNKLALSLAGIDTDARNKALATQQTQQSQKFQWDQNEAQRQFQAAEADRAFQRQQQLTRLQASLRPASGGAAQPSNKELFAGALAKAAGKDGKVAPGDYNALKNQWVASGYGDYKSFHDQFWKFANDKHWWDYK